MGKKKAALTGSFFSKKFFHELRDLANVNCVLSLFAINYFELNAVILTNFFSKSAVMNKNFSVIVISYNESISFRFIEKFYFTGFHWVINIGFTKASRSRCRLSIVLNYSI